MISHTKSQFLTGLNRPGFDDWQPSLDVRHLDRPRERPENLPGSGRFAAVLLLLYPKSHSATGCETHLVLTRRAEHLSKHPGQISLPGGRQDPGESLQQTALRETKEEIGVESDIEIIAQLNSVYIPPSDFTVTPFVGWVDAEPNFVKEEAEVAEIIEAPISQLADPKTLTFGELNVDGRRLNVPYYQLGHHNVWGATAIILSEFLERMSSTGE